MEAEVEAEVVAEVEVEAEAEADASRAPRCRVSLRVKPPHYVSGTVATGSKRSGMRARAVSQQASWQERAKKLQQARACGIQPYAPLSAAAVALADSIAQGPYNSEGDDDDEMECLVASTAPAAFPPPTCTSPTAPAPPGSVGGSPPNARSA